MKQFILPLILLLSLLFVVGGMYIFAKGNMQNYFTNNSRRATNKNWDNRFSVPEIPAPTMFNDINYSIRLGDEEKVDLADLKYVPDGHISKIEKEGSIMLFFSAHDKSYIIQGDNFGNLELMTDENSRPKVILKPEKSGFDKDYAGFGSVIQNKLTGNLIGIYHAEQRVSPDASDTQISSIGIAISRNNGTTWEKKGQIITGRNQLPLGTKTSGAGQPSAIIMGDYIYLYYTDWNYQILPSIHLARSPLSSDGLPGTWEKYNAGGFNSPGIGGSSDPVIYPWRWEKVIDYTSNASVSYNTYLKKYFVVFETNYGFFSGISDDGIYWTSYILFYPFRTNASIPKINGDIWYSYPSILSNGVGNLQTSDQGYLYYGRGEYGQTHNMVRRYYTITKN